MPRFLPEGGLLGHEALREAAAGSYQELMEKLEAAIRARLKLSLMPGFSVWSDVEALFPDVVVMREKGGFARYPYTVGPDGAVTIGEGQKVERREDFVPATARLAEAAGGGLVAKADRAKGPRFEVRVIRSGLSGNGAIYPPAVLEAAVDAGLFDKVKVIAKADKVHIAGGGKTPEAVIGRLTEARYMEDVDGNGTGSEGEIRATMDVLSVGGWPERLTEALDRDLGLWGLSIDVSSLVRRTSLNGKPIRVATKFEKVHSVDLIVDAGAGGEILRLMEAQGDAHPTTENGGSIVDRETIIALLREAKTLGDLDPTTATDDQLRERLTEAMRPPSPEKRESLTEAQVREIVAANSALSELREAAGDVIMGSALPEAAKKRLRATLREAAAEDLSTAAVEKLVKDELEYLTSSAGRAGVGGLGGISGITMGESRAEKLREALDAFFDPEHKSHRHARSIKQIYIEMTGDNLVTGNPRNCDAVRMAEALGSDTMANVLGDGINRRLLADYRTRTVFDSWRNICNVVPVNDFRTQERTRWGGYGDLPVVAENGPYTDLDSPGDEKAEYTVAKRGGVETLSFEMIKNDDVGAVRQIPIKLSRAAKRTLSKFVYAFISGNGLIYDGKALFHVDHGNLGTVALDEDSLEAARLAMYAQAEMDSNEPLWIGIKALLVPAALERTSVDMFRRTTENEKTFIQSLTPDIIPVPWFTDANDWAAVADPMEIPGLEVGFLDGNDEPELFVADDPKSGALFTNDQVKYKIRHIYGGAICDYRAFYKSVVA